MTSDDLTVGPRLGSIFDETFMEIDEAVAQAEEEARQARKQEYEQAQQALNAELEVGSRISGWMTIIEGDNADQYSLPSLKNTAAYAEKELGEDTQISEEIERTLGDIKKTAAAYKKKLEELEIQKERLGNHQYEALKKKLEDTFTSQVLPQIKRMAEESQEKAKELWVRLQRKQEEKTAAAGSKAAELKPEEMGSEGLPEFWQLKIVEAPETAETAKRRLKAAFGQTYPWRPATYEPNKGLEGFYRTQYQGGLEVTNSRHAEAEYLVERAADRFFNQMIQRHGEEKAIALCKTLDGSTAKIKNGVGMAYEGDKARRRSEAKNVHLNKISSALDNEETFIFYQEMQRLQFLGRIQNEDNKNDIQLREMETYLRITPDNGAWADQMEQTEEGWILVSGLEKLDGHASNNQLAKKVRERDPELIVDMEVITKTHSTLRKVLNYMEGDQHERRDIQGRRHGESEQNLYTLGTKRIQHLIDKRSRPDWRLQTIDVATIEEARGKADQIRVAAQRAIEASEARKAEAEQGIVTLRRELERGQREKAAIERVRDQRGDTIDTLTAEKEAAESEMRNRTRELRELREQVAGLEGELRKAKELAASLGKEAQNIGGLGASKKLKGAIRKTTEDIAKI